VPEVRPERDDDRAAIHRVNASAFQTEAEASLVDALRGTDAWVDGLSLVAEEGGEPVGHLLLSRVALESGAPLLALGPMAVVPERQRAGVGSALVEAGISAARETDYALIVVVGHPEYYPRFGFGPARAHGLECPWPVPDEAWMALPLLAAAEGGEGGLVVYPPPWSAV
jgi:putative acetyltransferase